MQWGCAALRLSRALCLLLSAPLCAQVSSRSLPCPSAASTQSGECCSCPPGFRAVVPCSFTNTQNHSAVEPDPECQPCPQGSLEEEHSAQAPCLPCKPSCGPGQVMRRACSHLSDTLCMENELQIPKGAEGNPPKEGSADPTASATSASTFVPPLPEDVGQNIIPVYCSLLAAVVVGLLAYVAFKWQKQQLAKARAAELGTAAEGEKLHSDSGVFLDTHSLQEPHQIGKASRLEARPYSTVPQQRREEVEQLLESGGPSGDWRGLAARLGYGDEAIGTFARGQAPTRTLLSTWAATEGATVEALCRALAAMGRQDVVECLAGPGDASSVV
ncbi:death domain-containing membrane protein NRADD-like isoform X2 [Coturnix japonica]|uniref:death domain-containing membrane protein NRADD-like isoform X2 n=1 Tax=Coturnix japonica TaxID=93934 RepID=UPI0007780417|nr:death domain-containing membrane protein NRADD-like isoform X2 [Coturnix japonica]